MVAALADLVLLHLQAVLAHTQAVACESILESDLLQQSEVCLSHGPSMCLALHGELMILLRTPFLDSAECWHESWKVAVLYLLGLERTALCS